MIVSVIDNLGKARLVKRSRTSTSRWGFRTEGLDHLASFPERVSRESITRAENRNLRAGRTRRSLSRRDRWGNRTAVSEAKW